MTDAIIISDSDSARAYLIEHLLPNFSDSTFKDYVRGELAGDFAFQLARYLQFNKSAVRDALKLTFVIAERNNLRTKISTANARIAELEARCPVSCHKREGKL